MNKSNYVYILKCSDNTLYCGWTNDLVERIKAHNMGKGAKYTKSRLPVDLVYSENSESKSDALRREIEIKKMKRSEKLTLINS
jgi:putative endonuclease